MALARKDMLLHITLEQGEVPTGIDTNSAEWQTANLKAFAILPRILGPTYWTMVRDAVSARNAWEILESFFVRRNLHNRIELRRQLHDFKMSGGADLLKHLTQCGHLCMAIAAVGEAVPDDDKLMILRSSLSVEYDSLVKLIENSRDVNLLGSKAMLQREFDRLQTRDNGEVAFQAGRRYNRNGRGGPRQAFASRQRSNGEFKGQCFPLWPEWP